MLKNAQKDFIQRHIGPSIEEQNIMLKELGYQNLDELSLYWLRIQNLASPPRLEEKRHLRQDSSFSSLHFTQSANYCHYAIIDCSKIRYF